MNLITTTMIKFKDTMNRWRTLSLFKETAPKKDFVIYTLDEARILFVESNDPTGYKFSTECLGGYNHWKALKNSGVAEHIEEWEEELEIKLRSTSVLNMLKLAEGDKGYQANKFLIDGGWKQKTAGRPSKKDINKNLQVKTKAYSEFNNVRDLKR